MTTITINNVKYTECTAINPDSGKREAAVYVHDLRDEFNDGDGVIFNANLPEDESDAKQLLEEYADTTDDTLRTVEY